MGSLFKAAVLGFKISFLLVLAFWLLLAMGVDLFPLSFFSWTGYLALFLFVGYNSYLWHLSQEDNGEAVDPA